MNKKIREATKKAFNEFMKNFGTWSAPESGLYHFHVNNFEMTISMDKGDKIVDKFVCASTKNEELL